MATTARDRGGGAVKLTCSRWGCWREAYGYVWRGPWMKQSFALCPAHGGPPEPPPDDGRAKRVLTPYGYHPIRGRRGTGEAGRG